MENPASKVILITGASSGIGEACAEHLASRGHRVFGTSRNPPGKRGAVEILPMDVTDDRSVRAITNAGDANHSPSLHPLLSGT